MENAADALKIAFAVFAFALAITILFSLVSLARSTADYIFYYGDRTNFYEEPMKSKNNKYRTVKTEDIISTLYRYNKESICVTIELGTNSKTFDQSLNDGKTTEDIENELADYINNTLLNYSNSEFLEKFTEVPTSGIYDEGGDGTEIIVSSGGKKVYITYTLN